MDIAFNTQPGPPPAETLSNSPLFTFQAYQPTQGGQPRYGFQSNGAEKPHGDCRMDP